MLQCRCSYGGPMRMERNEHGCPIHDTERYYKLSGAWSMYGWRLADPIREAIEQGGDVLKAIDEARDKLNRLEKIAVELS